MAFEGYPRAHYGAILADPPWRFRTWDNQEAIEARTSGALRYRTMPIEDICALPVAELAADHCALFLWISWPQLVDAIALITAWGFTYKSCAFDWTKAHAD